MKTQLALSYSIAAAAAALWACDDESETVAPTASASAPVAASTATQPEEKPPQGCQAPTDKPAKIGTVLGEVYGFKAHDQHIYYATWQLYGNRGDVGRLRKDGEGRRDMASLEFQPRGLDVDDKSIYYTEGIRLRSLPIEGGAARMPAKVFSSQTIAAHEGYLYGAPGDYGPYDRVAKIKLSGGTVEELADAPRPQKEGPRGYLQIAVDDSGIYVTDAGNDRLLKFPLEGGKPKVLASKQKKPFDLVMTEEHLYFNTALDGELMKVSKSGGKPTQLAEGLVPESPIAGDTNAVYAVVEPAKEEQPFRLVRIPPDGDGLDVVAVVPAEQPVNEMTLDEDCVYWAQRIDAGKSEVYALGRQK